MGLKNRYLTPFIREDLGEKMVFVGGPRQVGKTTLARELIGSALKSQYYSWDKLSQRQKALKGEWESEPQLIILDEFHKHRKWKTWLKGEYDHYKKEYKFLLTGSARLNIYRRGGDSLQGRYHYYRLHPFSLAEIEGLSPQSKPGDKLVFKSQVKSADLSLLKTFGGFPEPLIKQNARHLRRWHNERLERFLKEDVRDLTLIQDIGSLSLLIELLPEKVSSILSINSLSKDLGVNFRTMARWLDLFEQFYYCFRISPYQSRKFSAVKKEKKLYLWDWSPIQDLSRKFENMVASHLLKYCHYLYDVQGWKVDLYFLRDSTGREVDFVICLNNKPWFCVEVKNKDTNLSKHLFYFKEKLEIPFSYQITSEGSKDFEKNGIRVMPAAKFLSAFV